MSTSKAMYDLYVQKIALSNLKSKNMQDKSFNFKYIL